MDLRVKPESEEPNSAAQEAYEKLQILADLQEKMKEKENMEDLLSTEIGKLKSEELSMKEFADELKLLQHEKMLHVEELRIIHSDISTMENTIKQSQSEIVKRISSSKDLYLSHQNLVSQIARAQTKLGLSISTKTLNDNLDVIGVGEELFGTTQSKMDNCLSQFNSPAIFLDSSNQRDAILPPNSSATHSQSASQNNFSLDSLNIAPKCFPNPEQSSMALNLAATQQNAFQAHIENFFKHQSKLANQRSLLHQPMKSHSSSHVPHSTTSQGNGLLGISGSSVGPSQQHQLIRQHPAPMKACLSCHQQIHRNAPICPLCKAKSRSQNPKKPKKRNDDLE